MDTAEYIKYYKEIVPDVLCNEVMNYPWSFESSSFSSHKGKTDTTEERVQMDQVWVRNKHIYYEPLKAAFEYAIKQYSLEFPLFSVQHITDFRINKYKEGGFMSSHVDNIHHSHGQHYGYPQVSVLLYLNDDYEGGDFYIAGNKFEPEKGSVIVFPSNFMYPHEAEAVIKGQRWSIVAWLM